MGKLEARHFHMDAVLREVTSRRNCCRNLYDIEFGSLRPHANARSRSVTASNGLDYLQELTAPTDSEVTASADPEVCSVDVEFIVGACSRRSRPLSQGRTAIDDSWS